MVSLLSGRGLVYDYPGPLRAVDGVDLDLAAHELRVVCGPNGSGKSTLLKLLGGLLPLQAGSVTVNGRALDELSAGERARSVARVPQSLRTLPDVTVGHFVLAGRYANIDRWAGPRVADRESVTQALADADVGELAERPMAALSGGQRQRVLIARALAQDTQVLLVDEPTASLDPGHQVAVFSLLERLVAGGRGAVVVTHDLNLASQFASAIDLLQDGRIVTSGTPAEVLRPEVLVPIYGEHLHFGEAPDGRPIVVPWLTGEAQ